MKLTMTDVLRAEEELEVEALEWRKRLREGEMPAMLKEAYGLDDKDLIHYVDGKYGLQGCLLYVAGIIVGLRMANNAEVSNEV